MPVDYNQLLDTYIEETLENLADIDDALLSMDIDAPDPEQINKIFRSVHTIKGNSAIFKFQSMSTLMHGIETFLDKIRSSMLSLKKTHVDYLLKVSDSTRKILDDLKKKKPLDETLVSQLSDALQDILKRESSIREVSQKETNKSTPAQGFKITIHPQKDIFKRNLDPLGAFAMLHEEASFKATVMIDPLSELDMKDYDPLACYLSWEIELQGEISKEHILEILTWVFEEHDIVLSPIPTIDIKTPIEIQKKSVPAVPSPPLPTTASPTTLRISTDKIDSVMNAVGELFIIESMFKQTIKKFDPKTSSQLDETLDLLEKNTRYLQDSIMRIRMVPISFAINRFPRMVFEIASKTEKLVDFVIQGEQTEIDKTMIEKLTDPLLHLIRNAIDHGIEAPKVREKEGKNKTGSLQFISKQEGDNILIEIKDDGAGIDPEKIRSIAISKGLLAEDIKLSETKLYGFIFKPGFSTSEKVTEYSGRGVGLDVVEKNIRALGGAIQIESKIGVGTTFRIKLPLTLAIMDCQLLRVKKQTYIIPLLSILEMAQITAKNTIDENGKKYYKYHDQKINLIYLSSIFNREAPPMDIINLFVVVVQTTGGASALVCDELLVQQPIVIKNLAWKVPGTVGGTIMGDGSIGLILDVQEIVEIGSKTYDEQQFQSEGIFSRRLFQNEGSYPIESIQPIQPIQNKREATETTEKDETEATTENEYLCFSLSRSEYAINMIWVQEVIFSKNPTILPFSPPYLLGIINLRGNIIPLVDLRIFFGIEPCPTKKGITIIANIEKEGIIRVVGLVVDAIIDTQIIKKLDIGPIPKSGHLILRHYIQGLVYINQRIITLLQIQNILKDPSELTEAT